MRRSRVCGRTSVSSLYTYCRTREFCEFLPTSSLSACCRRPAPALPLYEVASPVLLVTMHSQPGRDLALGLRSLPAREGLRRFGRPPKERGGVPAWSSATSAHLSSLPSPVPDPSRLSRRLRSAADTVICSDLGSGAGAPRILHPLVGLGLPFPLSGFSWPWLALAPPLPCRWRFCSSGTLHLALP